MEPVGLGIKPPPDALHTVGSMMNIQNTAQQMQQRAQEIEKTGLDLQKLRQMNDERIATQQFMSNPSNWQDERGETDFNKLYKELPRIAPLTHQATIEAVSRTQEAKNVVNKSNRELSTGARAQAAGVLGVLGRMGVKDPNIYNGALELLAQQNPNDKTMGEVIQSFKKLFAGVPPNQRDGLPSGAIMFQQQLMGPAEQQEAFAPKVGTLSVGGGTIPTVTTPSVAGGQPSIAFGAGGAGPDAKGVENTLSPDTRTVNKETAQPEYLGRPFSSRATEKPAGTEKPAAPVPAGPLPTLESTLGQIGESFKAVKGRAQGSGQDIGILQDIKTLAPKAVTGAAQEKRQMIAKIMALFGMKKAEMTAEETDLFIKNSAMLSTAPRATTDAFRMLVEAMNPNVKMEKGAIIKAANIVIAQRRLDQEKERILTDVKNALDAGRLRSSDYTETEAKLNRIDPRVFSIPHMTKEEIREMAQAMTPGEREKFKKDVDEAKRMGIGK